MLIALTSYQRPEMTERALKNLLSLSGVTEIHTFIDGLRPNANSEEILWRAETIKRAEVLAEKNNIIKLIVWDKNIGYEENSERSFGPLFEKNNSIIVTEEDVLLTQKAFDFLIKISQNKTNFLATSYANSVHENSALSERKTLFPQLWGAAYSASIFEESLRIRKDAKIDPKLVASAIKLILPIPSLYRERLIRHWNWYFNHALKTHRHTDVLLQYGSWKKKTFAHAPLTPLSFDLAIQDHRGMNKRQNIEPPKVHKSEFRELDEFNYCKQCEIESSRIEPSTFSYILKKLGP